MNTKEFNKAVKPLTDKWTDDLVKDGLINRPNLSEEEKEHYNKVAMDKILESISEHIQDTIGDAYDLFAEGTITRQKYIDFLLLQAEMLNKEAEGHKEFMDNSEILKKMNTEESKEGVKKFFNESKHIENKENH